MKLEGLRWWFFDIFYSSLYKELHKEKFLNFPLKIKSFFFNASDLFLFLGEKNVYLYVNLREGLPVVYLYVNVCEGVVWSTCMLMYEKGVVCSTCM